MTSDIKIDEEWPHIDMNASHDFFSSDFFSEEILSLPVGSDSIFVQPPDENNESTVEKKKRKLSVGGEEDEGMNHLILGVDDGTFNENALTEFTAQLMPPASPALGTSTKKTGTSAKKSKKKATTVNESQTISDDAVRKAAQEAVAQLAGVAKTKPNVSAGTKAKQTKKAVGAKAQAVPVSNTPNPLLTAPQFNGIGKKTNSTTNSASGKVAVVEMSPVSNADPADMLHSSSAVATAAAAAASMYKSTSYVSEDGDYQSFLNSSASNSVSSASAPGSSKAKVNISSDHVHALTSSNWVAACSASGVANFASTSSANLSAQAQANKRRRQNLTADERAKQNRDRNREHARNTRLRKKAYVEELKRTLTEMVNQRDAVELERKRNAQRELEQREVRYRVLVEFLNLRARAESLPNKWNTILDSNFTFTLPITSYRESVSAEKRGLVRAVSGDVPKKTDPTEQVLVGTGDVMHDAELEVDFFNSFGKHLSENEIDKVTLKYECEKSNFLMDGCNGFLKWSMTTAGLMGRSAQAEVKLSGDVRGKFCSSSNKLLSVEMVFDTGSLMSQINTSFSHEESQHHLLSVDDADALLDAIPHITSLPKCISSSENSSSGSSSDEQESTKTAPVATRRSTRRN